MHRNKMALLRGAVLCLAIVLGCGARAADVLTQHNDVARTGANLAETVLTTTSVGGGTFGRLWSLYADGQVTAQPLYVSNMAVDTSARAGTPRVQGRFNAVIIATMHNTIYAYDADRAVAGPDGRTAPLWATWLGKPRPGGKDIDMWSTNDPDWGILGTPVVSNDKTTLYVVAWHDEGAGGLRYRLHALDLRSGAELRPAAPIGPSSTDASQPCRGQQNVFDPCLQKQRSALLLSGGVLYVGFGGDGNRGGLFAFDAATLTQKAFWSPTPRGVNGGIWQSGQGPAADAQGNIYLMTGNGTFDANAGGQDFGNSFVKLKLQGQTMAVQDYFTPCNTDFLNQLDLDLGSAGTLLVPDTPARIVGGGKQGVLYVLSPDKMGKFAASPTAPNCTNPNALQQVAAFPSQTHEGQTHWGNIHGSPVFWRGRDGAWVYAWGENSRLAAYKYAQGVLQDTANPGRSAFQPPTGMPGGMLAVSANGDAPGSGIVWAAVPLDGDANQQRGVRGIVMALDASDVSRTLWTSEQVAERDRLGLFAKFTSPMVAGGKLFMATYGDDEARRTYANNPSQQPTTFPANYQVVVYGMLPPPMPMATVVDQDRGDVAVVRAATEPLTLDTATCKTLDAGALDCTDALSAAAGAPAFHKVVFASGQGTAGCALLRVTVAARDTGLQASTGIGFWSTQALGGNQAAENAGRFSPAAQLKAAGTARLRDGAAATLESFAGVVGCASPRAAPAARLFKPYMEFKGGDGTVYHNWDLAANYRIDATVTGFDRSADVLAP